MAHFDAYLRYSDVLILILLSPPREGSAEGAVPLPRRGCALSQKMFDYY